MFSTTELSQRDLNFIEHFNKNFFVNACAETLKDIIIILKFRS
jgi:hypothetical protein